MKIEVDAITRATPIRLAAPLQITDISTYQALHFDPAQQPFGTLSYQFSKPAWVRIRLVARRDKQLVLRTLVDWSPRELGENSERWDGRDASSQMVDRRQCPCLFVIQGDSTEHAGHDRDLCGDMALRITQPQPEAVVFGQPAISVEFAGAKRGFGGEPGYMLRAYVDYAAAGQRHYPWPVEGPIQWPWDTTAVDDGPHLITVNIDDGHDHVGSASVRVEVGNSSK